MFKGSESHTVACFCNNSYRLRAANEPSSASALHYDVTNSRYSLIKPRSGSGFCTLPHKWTVQQTTSFIRCKKNSVFDGTQQSEGKTSIKCTKSFKDVSGRMELFAQVDWATDRRAWSSEMKFFITLNCRTDTSCFHPRIVSSSLSGWGRRVADTVWDAKKGHKCCCSTNSCWC